MNKANTFISLTTAVLVAFLAGGAFWLSFDALRGLALDNGVGLKTAWLYPAIIDGAILVFSLSVVQVSLNKERTAYPWLLVGLFTGLSVLLNIVHAERNFLAQAMAAIPPVALFLSFELLMNQVKATVNRATANLSLADLEIALAARRAELDEVVRRKEAELDNLVQNRTAALERLQASVVELEIVQVSRQAELDHLIRKRTAALEQLQADVERLPNQKAERPAERNGNLSELETTFRTPPAGDNNRTLDKEQAQAAVLDYLAGHPEATLVEIAAVVGRSKSTISTYLSQLKSAGRLNQNGAGWKVVGSKGGIGNEA
jgi:hypothetical protein